MAKGGVVENKWTLVENLRCRNIKYLVGVRKEDGDVTGVDRRVRIPGIYV